MKESNIEEERLSTEVTDEDLGRGVGDEYGVIYSPDGKRLLGCWDKENLGEYVVKEGTETICDYAFGGCGNLYSLILPAGLVSIGDYAIHGCHYLDSIILPDGLVSIGADAFAGCDNLDSVIFPESLISIGDRAFYGCRNLTSLAFPESLISIGDQAFGDCDRLSSVTIPKNVLEIGPRSFSRFTQIISDSPNFKMENDLLIQGATVISMTGGAKFLAVPPYIKQIGERAFCGCDNLSSVVLPEGLESIGNSAFSACDNLDSVVLPEGLVSIGSYAFKGCNHLRKIHIPESLRNLGTDPFSKATQIISKSPHVKVENGLLIFDTTVISMIGKDKRVVVPSYVTSIGRGAFQGCEKMVSISLPDTMTAIGDVVFWGCKKLKKILIRCSPSIDERFTVRRIQNLLPEDLKDKVKVDKSW